MSYPLERKEAILKKLLSADGISISELSKQERVSTKTLYTWRKTLKESGNLIVNKKTKAAQWSSPDKFSAVIETASKNEAELSVWCRKHGVYPDQLEEWRFACSQANDWRLSHQKTLEQQRKGDRNKITSLERELRRKEKALAETAALLVLRKKIQAIWGEQEEE